MSLFKDFGPVTVQQWKEQIVKELKLQSIEEIRNYANGGIPLEPFYTREHFKKATAPPVREHSDVCEHIAVKDEKSANASALKALNGGASGLVFHISKKTDAGILLKDISLEHIYCQFDVSNDAVHFITDLGEHYGKINPYDGRQKCFVNLDPLHLLAKFGEWHEDESKDLKILSRLKHIPLDTRLYKEAGANIVNHLAISLAHLKEYLDHLGESELPRYACIHCSTSVSGEFFTEIAALRAMRNLLAFLCEQYTFKPFIHIHAQTALLNKSSLDAYTNMLRTTTEGMSAVLGGCDSVSVLRYDHGFTEGSDFSRRIARNQLHILREESYLSKVNEIASGSYYIESLTDQIAERSWKKFQEIETKGGYIKCMMSGVLQDMIEKDADELLREVAASKKILVGVNKFENRNEKDEIKSRKPKADGPGVGKHCRTIRPVRLAKSFEEKRVGQNA